MDDDEPRWARESVVRAVLAFAAVPGIILALGALYTVTADIARVDALSRVLQGAMLAIIGFYFGRVGVARVERQVDSARQNASGMMEDARQAIENVEASKLEAAHADRVLAIIEADPTLRAKIDEEMRRRGGA